MACDQTVEAKTKAMWLGGGQFFCDTHRRVPSQTIPFLYAPIDAACAVCSDDAPESYLTRRVSND